MHSIQNFIKICVQRSKKASKIGYGQGLTPLLDHKDQEYIADVLAQQDCSKKGCDVSEAVDLVMEITDKVKEILLTSML